MSRYIANSAANLSSASGWDTVTNTPTLHATTNVSMTTTSRFTATFTAPNTTNACTGVMIYIVSATGLGTSITATLQQSSVDTAATVTATPDAMYSSGWVYLRFPTPFVFTTTAAGTYRFKITVPVNSLTAAADSGGTLYAFLATDDRHTLPTVGDDCWISGLNGNATTYTLDGTANSWGSGTEVTAGGLQRSMGNACTVSYGATLKWDTAASATLQLKGNLDIHPGGNWQMGTVASPYPSGKTAKLIFDNNGGTTALNGWHVFNGGTAILQGSPSPNTTTWKTNYVSGTGTAASPITVSATHGWSVGDSLAITATGNDANNYAQTEERYIISIPAANQIVVSSTRGGAETALAFTHTTDAWVLNIERNVIITSTNTAQPWSGFTRSTTQNTVLWKWVRYEYGGGSATSCTSGFLATTSTYQAVDYCVSYKAGYQGFAFNSTKTAETYTGLISAFQTSASTVAGLNLSSAANKNLTDCFVVGGNRVGIILSTVSAITMTRCYAIANNGAGSTITIATGGIVCTSAFANFVNCEVHCNRNMGVTLSSTAGSVFTNCNIGSKGNNIVSVNTITSTLEQAIFDNCNFSSTDTLLNGYLVLNDGTEIAFNKLNQTTSNHYWYSNYGSGRSTGAGLSDTNVRTPGSLGVAIRPEDNATGFTWSFFIPAKANSIVNFFGWFMLNSAFTGDAAASARVELWLPGSATADATTTLSKLTNAWQAGVLSAQNNLATDSLATVKVIALTATASAYLYCDDFYNAGDTISSSDKVTGLDAWYLGKPLTIIQPSATSAADIWTFPTTNLTTAGTTGNIVKKALTVGKFLGLK